jgi:hypothetical protein
MAGHGRPPLAMNLDERLPMGRFDEGIYWRALAHPSTNAQKGVKAARIGSSALAQAGVA